MEFLLLINTLTRLISASDEFVASDLPIKLQKNVAIFLQQFATNIMFFFMCLFVFGSNIH